MNLVGLVCRDEDALICDFAETYHIYDWRALPLRIAAALAFGLPPTSRSKRAGAGTPYTTTELLLATIADIVAMIQWAQTKDGHKNRNRPKSLFAELTGRNREEPSSCAGFASGEEFEKRRNEILQKGGE